MRKWAVVLAVLLMGCGGEQPTEASATLTPSATLDSLDGMIETKQPATPTNTPRPTGTATPPPTFTPFPFPTPENVIDFKYSPNNEWILWRTYNNDSIFLEITNINGEQIWEISPTDSELVPIHWSVDERYFYYSSVWFPDGGDQFGDYYGLNQLNLQTGKISRTINQTMIFVKFSDNERFIAYIKRNELSPSLVIQDNRTGQSITKILEGIDELRLGLFNLFWTPNNENILAYIDTQLLIFNRKSLEYRYIAEDLKYYIYDITWVNENIFTFDAYHLTENTIVGTYSMNIETGEIREVEE